MKSFLHAFSSRPFVYLWLSEVFTQLAVNIFNFLLVLIVFSLTTSNTAVAGVVLSYTIPAIIFGVVAGVYVDWWNKKKVLLLTNIIRAVLILVLVFFHTNLVAIYALSFLISIATQFFIPAETPLIPLSVTQKQLLSANALFGLGIYASLLLAYVVSGPMIIAFREVYTLIILAAFLFISSAFISMINLPRTKESKEGRKNITFAITREIREAIAITSSSKEIHHSLFMLALSQIMILVVAVIAPGYANQVLGIAVEEFPLLFVAPAAFGVIMGAIIITGLLQNKSKNKIINIGLFLSAASMFILPFGSKIATREIVLSLNHYLPRIIDITPLHLVVLIAFILGLANAFVFVPANTILMEATSDQQRGKVYGVLNTIVGIFSLLPIIAVGGLSDLIGVTQVIVGIGITLFVIAILRLTLDI